MAFAFCPPPPLKIWENFRVSDFFDEKRADKAAWSLVKEQGNEAFRKNDFELAAKFYKKSAKIALGPVEGGIWSAFTESLQVFPEGTVQRLFIDNEDVVNKLLTEHFPSPPPTPNKCLSLSWSNHAQALLMAGNPFGALMSARRACLADPSHMKAHHNEMKAQEALGNKDEAWKIKMQMDHFSRLHGNLSSEGQTLMLCQWIGWKEFEAIYKPIRLQEVALHATKKMAEVGCGVDEEKRIAIRASIVPFQGGQGLALTIVYGVKGDATCVDFCMLDHENGEIGEEGECNKRSELRCCKSMNQTNLSFRILKSLCFSCSIADKPPNGHASYMSQCAAPIRIGIFIEKLKVEYGFKTIALLCGQGLIDHIALVKQRLEEGPPNKEHPPLKGIMVYRARGTAASGDNGFENGVDPELMNLAYTTRLGLI